VLDEATSSVDTQTESLIQDGLRRLMRGRTSLVIAHRLSTIEGADRIVALDGGRVVEQGSHADLLAHGGLYARLHTLQFRS
jgi:ATP-binding cassette, subfamily B, bacterial MsbA